MAGVASEVELTEANEAVLKLGRGAYRSGGQDSGGGGGGGGYASEDECGCSLLLVLVIVWLAKLASTGVEKLGLKSPWRVRRARLRAADSEPAVVGGVVGGGGGGGKLKSMGRFAGQRHSLPVHEFNFTINIPFM